MEKDSKARLGRTQCDLCSQPSVYFVDGYLVCEAHARRARQPHGVKEAGDTSDLPLKAAPIAMSERHRDK